MKQKTKSPLLGGVWIEIINQATIAVQQLGHPSWEGCGLKFLKMAKAISSSRSPLLGGVWIEMP